MGPLVPMLLVSDHIAGLWEGLGVETVWIWRTTFRVIFEVLWLDIDLSRLHLLSDQIQSTRRVDAGIFTGDDNSLKAFPPHQTCISGEHQVRSLPAEKHGFTSEDPDKDGGG